MSNRGRIIVAYEKAICLVRDCAYYSKKRAHYLMRGEWPRIEYVGPGMFKVKKKRKFRQYKPEYITGEPDRLEYYKA